MRCSSSLIIFASQQELNFDAEYCQCLSTNFLWANYCTCMIKSLRSKMFDNRNFFLVEKCLPFPVISYISHTSTLKCESFIKLTTLIPYLWFQIPFHGYGFPLFSLLYTKFFDHVFCHQSTPQNKPTLNIIIFTQTNISMFHMSVNYQSHKKAHGSTQYEAFHSPSARVDLNKLPYEMINTYIYNYIRVQTILIK